jgi:hypothetical protein
MQLSKGGILDLRDYNIRVKAVCKKNCPQNIWDVQDSLLSLPHRKNETRARAQIVFSDPKKNLGPLKKLSLLKDLKNTIPSCTLF